MRAMRGGEGVVDEDVAVGGELFGEGRIVLFLALVEAGVFQKQDVAVARACRDCLGGFWPMQSAAKATGRPMISAMASAIGSSENSGSGPSFRPAEMRQQDDLGALVGKFEDGRRDALDAGRVA